MRILLDANILIPREHDWLVPEHLTTLLRMIAERKDTVLIHPLDQVLELAGKRIVYAQSEIQSMIDKHAVLILFRWHLDFQSDVPLRVLVSSGMLKAAPQSIVGLTHGSYLLLKREGGFENSLAVNQARIC